MYLIYWKTDLFAVLNVTSVTLNDELLFVLAFFRSARLSCQNALLYSPVESMFLHKQNTLWISYSGLQYALMDLSLVYCQCSFSSFVVLIGIWAPKLSTILTFPQFFPPSFKTGLEYPGSSPNVHANNSLWFTPKSHSFAYPNSWLGRVSFEMGSWLLTR